MKEVWRQDQATERGVMNFDVSVCVCVCVCVWEEEKKREEKPKDGKRTSLYSCQ